MATQFVGLCAIDPLIEQVPSTEHAPMAGNHKKLFFLLVVTAIVIGCSRGTSSTSFLSMGTAPVGGAFPVVGGAIAEVLNAHKDTIDWKVQAKGTKGSQENIRRLQQGDVRRAARPD